ncbi:hypothetical protein [Ammoniphilus sp. YIM 78166]|uniref:hypothetical protein n=1 Tax=Ammoniphilus sp. YIM 78166 TaxID=1644106 RepID=UPI00106F7CE4|nr:hypothetical protein [Ammoniphilus sp. YIM 78166]
MEVNVLIQRFIDEGVITQAEFDAMVEQYKKESPIILSVDNLQIRTEGLQEIDAFTLGKTMLLEQRAEGMQDIDDFALTLIMQLQSKIEELETRIIELEAK